MIGQIEVMQHYIKPSFAKNTQCTTKFFNSEVKCTWIFTKIYAHNQLLFVLL